MAIKKVYWALICFIIAGCPSYDPPTGTLQLVNKSDSTWYVYVSCDEKLSIDSKLLYRIDWDVEAYDEYGNKKDLSGFPHYRLAPNDTSVFAGFGSSAKRRINCDDRTLSLFFIKEEYMKNLSWEEICEEQKFSHKIDLTNQDLKRLDWKYVFNP